MSISSQDQFAERLQKCMNIEAENDRLKDNLARMLDQLGSLRKCKDCQQSIWWIYQPRTQKYQIYDSDGRPHRITCTKRKPVQVGTAHGR